MTADPDTFSGRCALVDEALDAWQASTERSAAIAITADRLGYAAADIEARLDEVAAACRSTEIQDACLRELGRPEPDNGPGEVIVLAAGTVPGLSIEASLPLLACGARVQVRPSRDDDILRPFARVLTRSADTFATRLMVVDQPSWNTADAASVHGRDETIEMVRRRLDGRPVAAYGTRIGIAVIDRGMADAIEAVADQLADDVMTFGQSGCMSPRQVLICDADERLVTSTASALERALASSISRHLTRATASPDAFALRRAADAEVLGGGLVRTVLAGPAEVVVRAVDGEAGLISWLDQHRSTLQTAVLACSNPESLLVWRPLLLGHGCSRVCAPGRAHHPPASWPHDGIGRIGPLWQRQAGPPDA